MGKSTEYKQAEAVTLLRVSMSVQDMLKPLMESMEKIAGSKPDKDGGVDVDGELVKDVLIQTVEAMTKIAKYFVKEADDVMKERDDEEVPDSPFN